MVEAWESGRWEKYAPNQTLPAKSALRLLKISDAQYAEIYENVNTFLHGKVATNLESVSAEAQDKDDDEVSDASDVAAPLPNPLTTQQTRQPYVKNARHEQTSLRSAPTLILTRKGFGGYDINAQPTNFIEPDEVEVKKQHDALSADARQVVTLIQTLCQECKAANDLLTRLMGLLISDGPFIRAALITLTPQRESADIYTAVGDGFLDGDTIAVKDPLSPLSLCLTQIKSFNAKAMDDSISPFGITSYAISPIKIEFESPVVLYADCGIDRPLPLEARKIFRLVIGLINHTLPRLPGGLPKKSVLPSPRS
jgi:hypothetical protein